MREATNEWRKDTPLEKGWYRARIDGEETELYFFRCEMSAKKRYWVDELGQKVMEPVEWTGEKLR